ncbi:hypothetical protein [Thermococcus sp.]|uniref:hypothetical protein n=1 Tax=Thermococcus sp. TaxID=35749 RepID=UPI002605368D|nr:hypothetical protein [Thermococcus sp.]
MKAGEELLGLVLYLSGILLAVVRPPVDRMACMTVPGGKVAEAVNPFFLTAEVGLVLAGSVLLSAGHNFKSGFTKLGWIGVASGLGVAFVGGYSGLRAVFLFGVLLATLGLVLYKLGGMRNANG